MKGIVIIRFWPDAQVDPLADGTLHRVVRAIFGEVDSNPISSKHLALPCGPYAAYQRLLCASRIVREALEAHKEFVSMRSRPLGIEIGTTDRCLAAMVSFQAFVAGSIPVFSPIFDPGNENEQRSLRGYVVHDPIPSQGAVGQEWIEVGRT